MPNNIRIAAILLTLFLAGIGAAAAADAVPEEEQSDWAKFKQGAKMAGGAIASGSRKAADAVASGAKKTGGAIAEGYEDAKEYVKEKLDD